MTQPLLQEFPQALVLTGPTGAGKSALALELAAELNAEIISMDSMTIYRHMDIGTAKPCKQELAQIPHHLIDVLDPWESANVAWWLERSRHVCLALQQRQKNILFVGGTPFYLKALMHGVFDAPKVPQEIRKQLEQEIESRGTTAMHQQLAEVDPISAKRIHPNDARRIVRGLEVYAATGKTLTELQQQGWFEKEEEQSLYVDRILCLETDREKLNEAINQRVVKMMAAGWLEEAEQLLTLEKPLSAEASKALGYSQLFAYLTNPGDLNAVVEEIQLRTRQFAKRQLTWFRNLSSLRFVTTKLTFDLWRAKIGH